MITSCSAARSSSSGEVDGAQPGRPPFPGRARLSQPGTLLPMLAHGAAGLALALLGVVLVTLIQGAAPLIGEHGLGFLWRGEWNPLQDSGRALAGVGEMLVTLLVALFVALLVSSGVALLLVGMGLTLLLLTEQLPGGRCLAGLVAELLARCRPEHPRARARQSG